MSDESVALANKMVAIRELKDEYLIGSQDAFCYLKTIGYYEKIQRDLFSEPGINFRPSVRDISLLCQEISFYAQLWLKLVSVQHSTTENFGVQAEHVVLMPWNRDRDIVVHGIKFHFWNIDFSMVLRELIKGENLPELSRLMLSFSTEISELSCFIIYDTQERLSMIDIINRLDVRDGYSKGFFDSVSATLMDYELHRHYSSSLSAEDAELLYEAKVAKDIEVCHEMIRKCDMRALIHLMGQCFESKEKLGNVTSEEVEFLLNSEKLFERAQREFTLGNFEVERKFAISFISSFDREEGESIESFVERITENAFRYLRRSEKKLKDLSDSVPDCLKENAVKSISQNRYTYLACYQNRRWLVKYFSR